jgi:Ca2+-binding EF-hand superfamily protein
MGLSLYFMDPFCALDVTLVTVDIVGALAASATQVSGARLLRLIRILKFFKFMRLLKGMRCVRSFYRKYLLSKAPVQSKPGVFAKWLQSLDSNGEGVFRLKQLQESLKAAKFVVSTAFLTTVFNDIYSQNAGLRQQLDDDIDTLLEDEDKTITLAEFEEYIRTLRAETHDERLATIARACSRSFRCWAIFGNLVAKIIMVLGLDYLGPLQAWQCMDWDPAYVVAQATFRSLNLIGCIGFNSLFYATAAANFDTFETAERTLAMIWTRGYGAEGSGTRLPNKRRMSMADALDCGVAVLALPTGPINIDTVKELLQQRKVHISEAGLARLFKKIDTSGDMLISVREIDIYVRSWEPPTRDRRLLSIAASLFSGTGMCLMFMMMGAVALLGNDFLWSTSLDKDTKVRIALASCLGIGFGVLGFMSLMYDGFTSEFETFQNARHTLLVSVQEEASWGEDGHQMLDDAAARSGIGITGMFAANQGTSAALWVKQILGSDRVFTSKQIDEYVRKLDKHPTASHIKYFAALLRRNVPRVQELTDMPVEIINRLQEALESEDENPWRTASLDMQSMQALLNRNRVFIPNHAFERLFKEIDSECSGRVSKPEFDHWMDSYRPMTVHQRRRLVLRDMLTNIGFYNLVAPLVGLLVIVIPLNGSDAYSLNVGIQAGRSLIFFGAVENMHQAWRSQAFTCDAFEHAKLELKASAENAVDELERIAHAKAAAHRKMQAVQVLTTVRTLQDHAVQDDACIQDEVHELVTSEMANIS